MVDADGNIVDEWTSGKEAHVIRELTVGKEYTLVETKPADGYVTAESVKFTIKDNQIRMSVHGNRKESVDAFLDGRNHEKYHYFCCSSGSSGNIYSFVLSHCCRKSGREKTDRNHEKRGRTE